MLVSAKARYSEIPAIKIKIRAQKHAYRDKADNYSRDKISAADASAGGKTYKKQKEKADRRGNEQLARFERVTK